MFEDAQGIEEMNSFSTGSLKRGQIGLLWRAPSAKWKRNAGKWQLIEFLADFKIITATGRL